MTNPADTRQYQHPRFGRFYLWFSQAAERRGTGEHRDRLLADLTGRVLEIGAGGGLNFAHYPETVTEVLAVEPDDLLRRHALDAAAAAPASVTVVAGTAEAIPAHDGAYDAAVASLVLCSVPDQATALAELRRVIHPGGELRFYEHVRSPHAWIGHLQDTIDPAWRRAFGGCHTNRNTADAIQAAGFEITDITRLTFGVTHILGRARRP